MKMVRFRIRWNHFRLLPGGCSMNRAAPTVLVASLRFFLRGLLPGLRVGEEPPPPPPSAPSVVSTRSSSSMEPAPGLGGASFAAIVVPLPPPRPRPRPRPRRADRVGVDDGDEAGDPELPAGTELERPMGGGEAGRSEPPGVYRVTVKAASSGSIAGHTGGSRATVRASSRIFGQFLRPRHNMYVFVDFRPCRTFS